jgi:hypothetical protein
VTRDESHVNVGGMLAPGQSGKKDDRGKKVCRNESNSWKVTQHTRMQESVHKESNNWRKNNTRAWEEDLTSVGLGFW